MTAAGPAPAAPASFEFDENFQDKIVTLALRDTSFNNKTKGLIDPAYFTNEVNAGFYSMAQTFFETYKAVPDRHSIKECIKDAIKARVLDKSAMPEIKDKLRKIYGASSLSGAGYIADKVTEFAKYRAIENAMINAIGALERRDFNAIEKLMKGALLVGQGDGSLGYDFWAEVENRQQKRIDLLSGKIKNEGISTGIPEIDKYMPQGGWGRKELSVMMGPAKAGKSMSLGEFAKNASLMGYNVLYVTLEVSADIISDRLEANISGVAMNLLKMDNATVAARTKAAAAKAGIFEIREYASGTLKVSQLERLIENYRSNGVIFDMIALDYADLMCPEDYRADRIEQLRRIYVDLRGIASVNNLAMVSATQTNRDGAKALSVKATDVAEDYNKIRTADIVLAINWTEEDRKASECRISVVAARNMKEVIWTVKQDRSRMRFISKVLSVEE